MVVHKADRLDGMRAWEAPAAWAAILFLASVAALMQSYLIIKVFFLSLFLLFAFLEAVQYGGILLYPRIAVFYLATGVVGIVWALVGLLSPGNFVEGVTDAIRLYVVWSLAYLILFSLLRSRDSLPLLHRALVVAALLIAAINFAGLYDRLAGLNLVSQSVRDDMNMKISVYSGYIQITTKNIGPLFLILPYLLAIQFRADAGAANSWVTKVGTVASLVLAAVSGRRALWLVAAMTPFVVLGLAWLTRSQARLRVSARRFVLLYSVAIAIVLPLSPGLLTDIREAVSFQKLSAAFGAADERTIQRSYLIERFKESPVLGSGFGANAGYTRSEDRPWTYELTYHQLLFNLGIVGVAALGAVFGLYFVRVIGVLRRFQERAAVPFALLVGFCSLLIGVYSNPYLSSFDLLCFVGLLPFLSTFGQGFGGSFEPRESSA